ncbi:transglycosylase domain-containing protein [Clostridium sp. LP20]|uniref:transglycosylase domain-containing protein n=1 Tax=Clostridium sp. LP20 TaxID=3418665 RepID=UPI003EE47F15
MATNKNSNTNKKTAKSPSKKSSPSKAPKKSSKKGSSKGKKIFKRVIFSMLFLFLAVFVVGLGYVFAVIKSAPPLDIDAIMNLSQPTSLYDDSGVFMDNLHSEVDRNVIEFNEMPQTLKDAYVAIEDQRFYSHKGIDIRRIAGSIVTDVVKILNGKSGMHGGSTLTQQLLKNTILSNEDFIIERKIKEIWLALNLEKELSKDQILHQYLNTIPLGGTAYGVDAASNLYFGKSASELNLIESAYIAGMTQAPTYYSGYNEASKNDPSRYINRTKTVLSKMKELNYINDDEYTQAIADLDAGKLVFNARKMSYTLDYEWYINPTVSQVKKDLKEKYKYTDEEVSKLLANGGLKIYTNMNKELQDFTQETLDNFSSTNVGYQETYIDGSKTPAFQASATVVDYKTGKVLAMVGGRGEHGGQALNRAYTDLRSIGSTTKPLTAYGPAINEKIMTAGSTIDDSFRSFDGYEPNNVDFRQDGNIPLRESLRQSKNIGTTSVVHTIGAKTALSYGEKFGLKYGAESKTLPTLALGQFQNATTDRDGGNTFIVSSAFGVFGNNGIYTEPKLYSTVKDSSGKVILDAEVKQKEIFSPQAAYIMYDMLKGSRGYTGPAAQWGSIPVAGKTGTTSENKDYWFAGLTPYLSGSVWLGYDKPKTMDGGSSLAASVWGKIMQKAHEGKEVTDIQMPSGIVKAPVCIDSGKTPTDLCNADPRGNRVYEEMFIEGTQPTGLCEAHVLAKVNSSNNKLATANTPSNLITEKVFVKKDNPNPSTDDYQYILPTEVDDTVAVPTNPSDKEDKDKDKDNNEKDEDDDKKPDNGDNNSGNENNGGSNNGEKPIKPNRSVFSLTAPNGYIINPMIRITRLINI